MHNNETHLLMCSVPWSHMTMKWMTGLLWRGCYAPLERVEAPAQVHILRALETSSRTRGYLGTSESSQFWNSKRVNTTTLVLRLLQNSQRCSENTKVFLLHKPRLEHTLPTVNNPSPSETTAPLLSLGWIFRRSVCPSPSSTMLQVSALSSAACLDEWDLCPWASAQRSKIWWFFCSVPSQRELPPVVTMTKSVICCWSGAVKCMSRLYLLLRWWWTWPAFILALLYSFQHWDLHPIKDRKEALTRHESPRKSSKTVHKPLDGKKKKKKVLSRTDFAFCLTVPLRHSSCQTGGTDCCFEPMEYAWPHNMAPVMNITVESCAYVECIPILQKDLGQ